MKPDGTISVSAKSIMEIAEGAGKCANQANWLLQRIGDMLIRQPPVGPARIPDEVVSVAEAAEILHLSGRSVFRLVKEGHLTRVKFPGRARGHGITRTSLKALLAQAGDAG